MPQRTKHHPDWIADGARILTLLRRASMTQSEFAMLMGVKPDVVTRWIKGIQSFDVHSLRKTACSILDCSMAELDGDVAIKPHSRLTDSERKIMAWVFHYEEQDLRHMKIHLLKKLSGEN